MACLPLFWEGVKVKFFTRKHILQVPWRPGPVAVLTHFADAGTFERIPNFRSKLCRYYARVSFCPGTVPRFNSIAMTLYIGLICASYTHLTGRHTERVVLTTGNLLPAVENKHHELCSSVCYAATSSIYISSEPPCRCSLYNLLWNNL